MADLPKKLENKLKERDTNNALRKLQLSQTLIDFSSNDYLGLASSEEVFRTSSEVLLDRGIQQNGSTGSRLLSGNSSLFIETEEMLKSFYGSESALLFNSGYDANLSFFSTIPQRGDVVFYDELIHASIRDGIKLGNAKSYKFSHNSLDDLRRHIERSRNVQGDSDSELYVATESVFSMDGDSPDLEALINFCAETRCHLVVDEAHAVGIFGTKGGGLLRKLRMEEKVFARIVTFGKAFGTHGAAVLGGKDLKTFLVNFARNFIYSTGLPPHSLAGILAAHTYQNGPKGSELKAKLIKNCLFFQDQIKNRGLQSQFIKSKSAIQSCIVPGNDEVKKISEILKEKKFDVRPILSPTVPQGSERLRFCIHSHNSEEEISQVLAILAAVL